MSNNNILGLRHVTALSSDAQKNVDFYAGILGIRMVKKTINVDAPHVYHLYYGDNEGSPGTLMTFFPYPGMAIDEDTDRPGEELKLPPWQESNREIIESNLQTITFDSKKFRDSSVTSVHR